MSAHVIVMSLNYDYEEYDRVKATQKMWMQMSTKLMLKLPCGKMSVQKFEKIWENSGFLDKLIFDRYLESKDFTLKFLAEKTQWLCLEI